MHRRHVWMINHHATIPSIGGGGGRHISLAEGLLNFGWTTSLIVASTSHPNGRQNLSGWRRRRVTKERGVDVLCIKATPYHNTVQRFLGMIFFTCNLLFPGAYKGLERPDVVIGSTVHPLAALAGHRIAKRFSVPFVYEIRDVWPETLIDMGKMKERGLPSRLLTGISKYLIQQCDLVLSPLPYIANYIEEMGCSGKRIIVVPNGFQNTITEVQAPPVSNGFTFMYLGAHGLANALDTVLDAFELASEKRPDLDLKIRFVGDGPEKDRLSLRASSSPVAASISFEDKIPVADVPARALEADCLVVSLLDLPVYRFGVSLNKFFTYLSVGLPSIVCSNAPNNPIDEAGAGLSVPSNNPELTAEALIRMAELPVETRLEMGAAGVAHLREFYTYDLLAEELAAGLGELAPGRD